MRILLVSPNIYKVPYPIYPLGLDFIAEGLRRNHDVKIADLNQIPIDQLISHYVKAFKPDLIGVSLRNIDTSDQASPDHFIAYFRSTIAMIKKVTKAPIVLGGSGFSLFPHQLLKLLEAQYGIIGDGERMVQLVDALENGYSVGDIDGLISSGVDNTKASGVNRTDNLNHPPLSPDAVPYYLSNGGMLNLQTKRGCPYRCIYCSYPMIEGGVLRYLPPRKVAQVAKTLEEMGAKFIFITDSVFNADYSHSSEVARAFAHEKLGIPWGAFFTPNKPPSGYFHRLVEAGLTHVEFGTDTLSNQMLKSYQKPFRVAQVLKAHQAASEAGSHVAHYLTLGGPGETQSTIEETLSNVDKLHRSVLFFFGGMRIYPHTPLYKIAIAEKQIAPDDDILSPVFYRSKGVGNLDILKQIQSVAKGRPNWVIGSGGEKATEILKRMYAKGYSGPLWEYLLL
jgi:radical SAM superfamily enzyme YgiQ (UPF0313 family)